MAFAVCFSFFFLTHHHVRGTRQVHVKKNCAAPQKKKKTQSSMDYIIQRGRISITTNTYRTPAVSSSSSAVSHSNTHSQFFVFVCHTQSVFVLPLLTVCITLAISMYDKVTVLCPYHTCRERSCCVRIKQRLARSPRSKNRTSNNKKTSAGETPGRVNELPQPKPCS